MKRDEILEKLKEDEHYYGEFGKKFRSNSDIYTLLNNPLAFRQTQPSNPNFLIGGYFHTAILEPDKLKNFRIVEASSRNTKAYKEISGGELCLLQHEVDKVNLMTEKLLENDVLRDLIRNDCEYEVPGLGEISGELWKGKADVLNHSEKLIIDLKTTSDISKFKWSASKYNYDSQAYIYQTLFGYDMVFLAIDKNTHQIGLYDCSPHFLNKGKEKVEKAVEQYRLFFENEDFEPSQFFTNETL